LAYAFVAGTSAASSDGGTVTTSAIDTTGADTLFAFICGNSAYIPTWTDSKGNTWTALTAYEVSGATRGRWWYAKAATVGAGHTVTISIGNLPAVAFLAFSGGHATAPFLSENGLGTSYGSSGQGGSVTPSEDNCLVLSGCVDHVAATESVNQGFTIASQVSASANAKGAAAAYLIETTAAAKDPTWTHSADNASSIANAVFKSASGGAGLALDPPTAGTPALTAIVTVTGTAATGGVSPYTYQWYRSTTSGFTPGGGNILSGKTSLVLNDTGLTPGTTYSYVLRATDNASTTADSAEVAVATPSGTGGALILLIGP